MNLKGMSKHIICLEVGWIVMLDIKNVYDSLTLIFIVPLKFLSVPLNLSILIVWMVAAG
jgi:hypothetical protein